MPRLPAFLLLLLALPACDTASEERPLFVPGEVLVSLQDGVGTAEFRPYVEADAELEWIGPVAEYVLVGVPEGAEEAAAERLEREATAYVASAQPNYYAYTEASASHPR